jgi:molybdopterin molybdotransferase
MAVTVEEAITIIHQTIQSKSHELLPIESVCGRVLAQNVTATHNLPPYDNSAMDGYAVKVSDSGKSVHVLNTIFAGDNDNTMIYDGSCCKIMTGARIPEGTECIVPVENTEPDGDHVRLPKNLKASQHIRLCGEDIESGDQLLETGERLYAHHITLLASQGISHVKVYKKPRIALFASGSELKMHFETVKAYQLYNTKRRPSQPVQKNSAVTSISSAQPKTLSKRSNRTSKVHSTVT